MSSPPPPDPPGADDSIAYELLSRLDQAWNAGRPKRLAEVCPDDRPNVLAAVLRRLDPPTAPPGYELVRELGRGGFGVVYLARWTPDGGAARTVALKFPLSRDPNDHRRFAYEAAAAATVLHPNVVRVYDADEHRGWPYLALEYLPGGSLADRLAGRRPMPPADAAGLVRKVADGVAAVHVAGLVHRDLKPGNILFAADGEPHVTDFGLVRVADSNLTATAAQVGTPHYMSPEQAAGRSRAVLPPADVWALGVILYECLTGTRPFPGPGVAEVWEQVRAARPVPVRRLAPDVPRPLARVVECCLRWSPEFRYPDAGELAADLKRYLDRKPIQGRPVRPVERTVEWMRRKPADAAAVVLGLVIVVLAVVLLNVVTANREREAAQEQARTIRESLLTSAKYGRTLDAIHQNWRDRPADPDLGDRLDRTDPAVRGWEWGYLTRLARPSWFKPGKPAGEVNAVAYHPSGRRLLTGYENGSVVEWDATTRDPIRTIQIGRKEDGILDPVQAVAYSPDGTRAAAAADGTVRVFAAAAGGADEPPRKHASPVRALGFSPDGSRLVTACDDGSAYLWPTAGGNPIPWRAHTGPAVSAEFGPDGAVLTAGSDGAVRVWDATAATPRKRNETEPGGAVHTARFSPDGSRVLTASSDGLVRIWGGVGGEFKVLAALAGHDGPAYAAAFSPDGRRVVSAGQDRTARVWDAAGRTQLFVLKGHANWVRAAAFSPDGSRIVTASSDGNTGLWDATHGGESFPLTGLVGPVTAVGFGADSTRVAAASDGGVRWWDATTGVAVAAAPGEAGPARPSGTARHGTRTLNVRPDGTVVVSEEGPTGGEFVLDGHDGPVHAAAFDPTGARIVTAGEDRTVRVWDAYGTSLLVLRGHQVGVRVVAWSADGRRIASGAADGSVRVWTATAGRP